MSIKRKFIIITAINATAAFVLIKPAHAYLDPGTLSYFLQTLIALLVGLSVTIKLYWNGIVSFFKKNGTKDGGQKNDGGAGHNHTKGGTENGEDETNDGAENLNKAEMDAAGDGVKKNGKAQ